MILRFGASNFLSISEYQEISFVASSLKDAGAELISARTLKEQILPVVLIYGANASGKSNLLAAFRFFRNAIVSSQVSSRPNQRIPRIPFGLDETYRTVPTQMDCDFVLSGIRYHYGFCTNSNEFSEEWLFAYPQGKRQEWFYRNGVSIKAGKSLRGQNKTIESIMRPNSLFLSAAAQSNHEQLSAIYNYFSDKITVANLVEMAPVQNVSVGKEGIDTRIIEFLRRADTGINSFVLEDTEISESGKRIVEKLAKIFSEEFPESNFFDVSLENPKQLKFGHTSPSGNVIYFDINQESRGTLKLYSLLQLVYKTIDRGGLLIVDEIDSSVHTLLAAEVIDIFSRLQSNPNGSQLLATTHDTNLLCLGSIRRDQIWFTEKDRNGSTAVYPLTDIRTRNTDNLERGYLQGRFGAIPYAGSVRRLLFNSAI